MSDEFVKEYVKRFGERGALDVEQTLKQVDLDTLTEHTEEVCQVFCNCGAPLKAVDDTYPVYRCASCDNLSCQLCVIRHSRYHYCPTCLKFGFLDKHAYLALLLIDHDLMAPDELVTIETFGEEPVEVTVDPAANTLLEADYIAEDENLTPQGKEALAIGHQLFGEDADIQSVRHRIRIQEVADR
jgi:hypothetical protein